jgi:poly-gamma-glutamate capsule biosynthesis protein CapA/YwtB (metallophosphatase superfamily)
VIALGRHRPGSAARSHSIVRRLASLAALAVLAAAGGCSDPTLAIPPPATPWLRAATSPALSPSAAASLPTSTVSPAVAYVPLVPIVGFWSNLRSVDRSDLRLLLAGSPRPGGPRFTAVAVATPDAAALARALNIQLAPSVHVASAADVLALVGSDPGVLGIVRAEDVQVGVRALAVDGFSLFGSGRMKDPGAWPLSVRSTAPSTFDTSAMWTLTAGGDVNLDRSVYVASVRRGKGADFPWDGGTARIAGLTCCGFEGAVLPLVRRTGNPGALRFLLSNSDLSIVNLEGLASEDFVYRPGGYTFTIDPDLLDGLAGAGIDAVSLANNHTMDVGADGIAQTRRKLDSIGVAHAGAGPDLASASEPAWLSAAGLKIAFLAYADPHNRNWAGPSKAGAARLDIGAVVSDIKAARAAGADFVIVMPHWGSEYTLYVGRQQRNQAQAMVAAGADVILGSHSHYVGGMQTFARPSGDPALVAYSLGNLLFDFSYDRQTLEGVIYELTFDGARLVQVELNPTIMVASSQTNLLDPAGDGAAVIDQIRSASGRYLSW